MKDRSKVLIHFLCDNEFFQLVRFLNYHFIPNFSQTVPLLRCFAPTDGAARIFPTTLCRDWESNSRRNKVGPYLITQDPYWKGDTVTPESFFNDSKLFSHKLQNV